MSQYVNVSATVAQLVSKTTMPRLSNGVGIDIQRLIEDTYDLDIAFVPNLALNGRPLQGLLIPDRSLVFVEANDPPSRQRFTLAHELGHLILDFNNHGAPTLFEAAYEPVMFRCAGQDVVSEAAPAPWRQLRETLANKFAAELLMPATVCRESWRRASNLTACCEALGTSREATAIRFAELGFIAGATNQNTYVARRQESGTNF
jgi:Zn-dependent peptidase ImmA (M78 family)